MKQNTQCGSVFFYILLAVVLLAALSYAVSHGSRTGASALTDEQARLAAQEIIDYGNTVANAVQKLRLRGFKDTEISFGNNVYKDASNILLNAPGHNANCTSNDCEIFVSQGGVLSPATFTNSSTKDNLQAGNIQFITVDISGIGTTEKELVLKLYRIKPEVCKKINRLLNVGTGDYLPSADSWDQNLYNGSFNTPTDPIGDVETLLSGKNAFCHNSSTGYYHYFQVLIAR